MRILVTGSNGFVGRHLARELAGHGHEVVGFDLAAAATTGSVAEHVSGDIQDKPAVRTAVASLKPDGCVHLGGISFVPAAVRDPSTLFAVNVLGTVNLLEALRTASPGTRVLVVSSANVYGETASPAPITEQTPLAPGTLYAISKAAADLTTLQYAGLHRLHAMTARPTNHIGPGQSGQFVIPALAQQVKAVARDEAPPVIKVGNLDSVRDFSDVRDVVRAYRLLIEQGRAGQAYNISSGARVRIGSVLDDLCAMAGVKPEIVVDPAKFRPTDESPRLDTAKLRTDTGWQPEIALKTTLRDVAADIGLL